MIWDKSFNSRIAVFRRADFPVFFFHSDTPVKIGDAPLIGELPGE